MVDPRMPMQANSYEDTGNGGAGRPFPWGQHQPNLPLPGPPMHGIVGGGGGRRLSTEGPSLYDKSASWNTSKEGSPMQWQRREEEYLFERRRPPPEQPPQPAQRMRSASPFGGGDEELENPIMAQAKTMLARVMACRTPDDPKNADIVRGERHLSIALPCSCRTSHFCLVRRRRRRETRTVCLEDPRESDCRL